MKRIVGRIKEPLHFSQAKCGGYSIYDANNRLVCMFYDPNSGNIDSGIVKLMSDREAKRLGGVFSLSLEMFEFVKVVERSVPRHSYLDIEARNIIAKVKK